MVALLELPLPCIATENRAAMAVNAIDEVLAGHAHNTPSPALQVAVVDIIPFLHSASPASVQLYYSSRGVAGKRLGGMSTKSSLSTHGDDVLARRARNMPLQTKTVVIVCVQHRSPTKQHPLGLKDYFQR